VGVDIDPWEYSDDLAATGRDIDRVAQVRMIASGDYAAGRPQYIGKYLLHAPTVAEIRSMCASVAAECG
jgi:hypothetical protein